jgi:hypothetical protein
VDERQRAAFAQLGLSPDATIDDIRLARRDLAKQLHPDRGGSEAVMQAINAAVDVAVRSVRDRRQSSDRSAPSASPGEVRPPSAMSPTLRDRRHNWVARDEPSFTIDALPAEAFEALVIVASWHGDLIDDEPPYVLDIHLYDPSECVCRVGLVPEAGGSTVSLTVARAPGAGPPPDPEAVRDQFVADLNRLGDDWPRP